jgi:hypothetical protein
LFWFLFLPELSRLVASVVLLNQRIAKRNATQKQTRSLIGKTLALIGRIQAWKTNVILNTRFNSAKETEPGVPPTIVQEPQ